MHGGAPNSGAPSGERNGMWRHGLYSKATIELRRHIRQLIRQSRETIGEF